MNRLSFCFKSNVDSKSTVLSKFTEWDVDRQCTNSRWPRWNGEHAQCLHPQPPAARISRSKIQRNLLQQARVAKNVWSVWQKNALKMRFLLRKLKAYKLVVSLWVCYCKSPLKRFTKKVSRFLLKRGMWRPLRAWVIDSNGSNLTHAQRLWTAVKNVRGAKCQKRGSLPSLPFHLVPSSKLSRFEDRTGSSG